MASFKWRKALEISPFLTQNRKKLQMTRSAKICSLICMRLCKKSRNLQFKEKVGKKFMKKQGKYLWITETLTVYHYFSPTEFFSLCFSKLNLFPPPPGVGWRFWPRYLSLRTIVNFLEISSDPSQSIGIEIFKEWIFLLSKIWLNHGLTRKDKQLSGINLIFFTV